MAAATDFQHMADDAIPELLREGEQCLLGTVQLALAADQRGTTITGVFGAGAVALLAGAATIAEGQQSLLSAFLSAATVLFTAALLTAWSARPVDFYVPGYEPRLLSQCGGDLNWMLRCSSADVQNRIDQNRRVLIRASRHFNAGIILAAVSPFSGIAGYLLTNSLPS